MNHTLPIASRPPFHPFPSLFQESVPLIKKGDVIGCALDLTVPIITFYVNGRQVNGAFTGFNLDGMFFPVVSASAKLRWGVLVSLPAEGVKLLS